MDGELSSAPDRSANPPGNDARARSQNSSSVRTAEPECPKTLLLSGMRVVDDANSSAERAAAALAYLTLVAELSSCCSRLSKNRFVRFHAWQSILL